MFNIWRKRSKKVLAKIKKYIRTDLKFIQKNG